MLPEDTTARRGSRLLERDFGPGSVGPNQRGGRAVCRAPSSEPEFLADLSGVIRQPRRGCRGRRRREHRRRAPGPHTGRLRDAIQRWCVAGELRTSRRCGDALVSTASGSTVTLVPHPEHSAETDEAKGLVKRIRDDYASTMANRRQCLVGGVPAENQDMTGAPRRPRSAGHSRRPYHHLHLPGACAALPGAPGQSHRPEPALRVRQLRRPRRHLPVRLRRRASWPSTARDSSTPGALSSWFALLFGLKHGLHEMFLLKAPSGTI